jgi:cysteine desulfurase
LLRAAEQCSPADVPPGLARIDPRGLVDLADFSTWLARPTRLASVMLANHETGVVQPVRELVAICRAAGVALHADASQAVGRLPLHFRELGVAAMTVSPHKFGGPVGVGALVVRSDVPLTALFHGSQQQGLRAGTPSVALAVGFQAALEVWANEGEQRTQRLQTLRDRFESQLVEGLRNIAVHGVGAPRAPQTSCISFLGLDRQALLMALDASGVCCANGPACASGSSEPSPALVAMGLPAEQIGSALRFSVGWNTTEDDVDLAIGRILNAVNTLRNRFGG